MLGDTNLNQINELKEEQTNKNQEQRSKNGSGNIVGKSQGKAGTAAARGRIISRICFQACSNVWGLDKTAEGCPHTKLV